MPSLERIRKRKLVQWALAYLAGAWVLLQVLDLIADTFNWPDFVLQATTVLLGIGLFGALVLAWYHGEKGEQRVSGMEVAMLAGILVIAGAGVAWVRASTGPDAAGSDTARAAPAPVSDPAPAEQGSIAVLPFENMSADEDNEYFSDGITEELLNVLAQLPELRVASRTSAFAFKGEDVGIDSIARALNVRHVLEGSVRKAGDRVRITAQLIDAETGYHLWSASYDRTLEDIFAVQDEISRAIVDRLQIELGGGRAEGPLAEVETTDPEAHTLVLKARQIGLQATKEANEQAVALLEEALARDPEYAAAHAELARIYEGQAYYGYVPREEGLASARAAAERALALDSTTALAHYMLGLIASDYDWDWRAAERHFARAIEHNPGFSKAYNLRGWLLLRLGRIEEALASARRAVELDPVSPAAYNNAGAVYTYAGRMQRAQELLEEAHRLAPGNPVINTSLALSYSGLHRHAEAIRAAEAAAEAAPEFPNAVAVLAYVHARAGRRERAERDLEDLRAMPGTTAYDLAMAHAALGDRGRVLDLLERAVDEHDPRVPDLGHDPAFRDYRDSPRVKRLLERMGLS